MGSKVMRAVLIFIMDLYFYKKVLHMNEFKVINGIGIIPQGTSVIETDSFYRNEDLRHIEIPEGVIYINSSESVTTQW